MANPELLILRHAKSDWYSGAQTDFERPLNKRGRKNAPLIGTWIKQHHYQPDLIVASPAARAAMTIQLVCATARIDQTKIKWRQQVYHASLDTLLETVRTEAEQSTAPVQRLMLVGHNPGLDDLLLYLCRQTPATEDGKLLTTACLAIVRMPDWEMRADSAELIEYIRAKHLKHRFSQYD